ncbi:MAG TPA: hypothetical protein VFA20_31620 [Myxococcaceae bacterium]|nr:hypothetical protein [Myxococcaceae bacterium]
MLSIDVKVGRLLEIRFVAPITLEELEAGMTRLAQLFRVRRDKLVGVGDFSRATVFAPDVANKLLEVLKFDNPRIERSGILVSASAIFSLQLERLLAHAENINRRTFRDPFELKTFLGGLLTHGEHGRLAQFLSEKP